MQQHKLAALNTPMSALTVLVKVQMRNGLQGCIATFVAALDNRRAPGFGSASNAQIDFRTTEMVSAGLH